MSTKKKAPALRDQILDFLRTHDEATLKQIAAATTERDYPSRVTAELNKLRIEAAVECEKKKGKNELWYWLAQATTRPQPAVGKNAGSSASDDDSSSAEGAAVHTQSAPAAAVPPSAAPAEADVKPQTAEFPPKITPPITPEPAASDEAARDDAMPPADAALLALANRELADRLARVAHVLRGSGLEALKSLDDGADLQVAAAAVTGAYQMAIADLDVRREQIADLQGTVDRLDHELFSQAALVIDLRSQIESLQREAMRGASLLSAATGYTAAGYLVRTTKRKPRTLLDKDKAREAALGAIRAGAPRAEVFALVPVGKAVRGAEWRPA